MENYSYPASVGKKTVIKRIAAPLAFIGAICLLVIFCYDAGHSGLPPTEKRYMAAKANFTSLSRDARKNMLREPWEKLAGEFHAIYDADPGWPNRPAALFREAESLEELARRSCSRQDARKAVNCYEKLALRHASSRLADDALFRAARIRAALLKDEKGALALLARVSAQYPRGDMAAEAAALEKAIRASVNGKTAPDILRTLDSGRTAGKDDDPPLTDKAAKTGKLSGDLPLRYKAAKTRMDALRKDTLKACWRQPWEELRDEFLLLHQSGKTRLAGGALFYAATCQQYLANCSRLSADSQKAKQLFLSVSSRYPKNALADDALLNAARLANATKNGRDEALACLDKILRDYPKGDMAAEAARLRASWRQAGNGKGMAAAKAPKPVKSATPPELQVLSWNSPNKNSVEIVLEMSAPAVYATRLEEAAKGRPARLFVDLDNASIISDVRKGVTVNGSLLKAVRVRDRKGGGATLQFDFREVRRFDVRGEDDPCRIVLSVAAGKGVPARKNEGSTLSAGAKKATRPARPAANISQVSNMASQLGLTVGRVFIDAGHGGKDPGTSHNNILERMITLDIATDLGRLLEANGLEVIYSRVNNRAVALSERTRMANRARADLFVSIHVNANENTAVSGFETYYLNLASTPQAARLAMLENTGSDRRLADMRSMLADVMLNARVDESKRLAADIQRVAMFRLKKRNYSVRNNGVKSAPFHVLLGAQMPAVLVEVGYCTNVPEARNLASPKYRHSLAEGLAEGIMAYRDRLANNRTARNTLTGKAADAM